MLSRFISWPFSPHNRHDRPAIESKRRESRSRPRHAEPRLELLEERALLASIGGTLREDITGDGPTADDMPLAGWTVRLFQDDGDGQFDAATDTQAGSQPSGSDGAYGFTGLAAGTYFVAQDVAAGWVEITNPAATTVVLNDVTDVVGLDFGNFEFVSIMGQKFEDLNGDSNHDSNEPGLNGWTIRLLDASGQVISETTTHDVDFDGDSEIDPMTESGLYQFDNVGPGRLFVQEVNEGGWFQTLPQGMTQSSTIVTNSPLPHPTAPPSNPTAPMLPDLYIDSLTQNSGINSWFLSGNEIRFGQATANMGLGPLELVASDVQPDGSQAVLQRVFDNHGGFTERVAGYFIYHPTHHHTHFEGFALYHLREVLPDSNGDGVPEVGAIVASSQKTSFCVIDIRVFDNTLPTFGPHDPTQEHCDGFQRLNVGWEDIYDPHTDGQSIDIANVSPGDYWLEEIADPDDHIQELDETNNVARAIVTLPVNGSTQAITVRTTSGHDTTGADFGDFHAITIRGHVFDDSNGNGIEDAGEAGISRAVVFDDVNGDGVLNNDIEGNGTCTPLASEPCTLAAADGDYGFTSFSPGWKVPSVVVPAVRVLTLPTQRYGFTASSGDIFPGTDFGIFAGSPLRIDQLRVVSSGGVITSLVLQFNESANANQAALKTNYQLYATSVSHGQVVDASPKLRLKTKSVSYDDATRTVTITPAKPLKANRVYRLYVSGLSDFGGHGFDGNGDGTAGDSYGAIFGIGTQLTFADRDGDVVTLALFGAGNMQFTRTSRDAFGELLLAGTTPAASTLSGWFSGGGGDAAVTVKLAARSTPVTRTLPAGITLVDSNGSVISAVVVDALLKAIAT